MDFLLKIRYFRQECLSKTWKPVPTIKYHIHWAYKENIKIWLYQAQYCYENFNNVIEDLGIDWIIPDLAFVISKSKFTNVNELLYKWLNICINSDNEYVFHDIYKYRLGRDVVKAYTDENYRIIRKICAKPMKYSSYLYFLVDTIGIVPYDRMYCYLLKKNKIDKIIEWMIKFKNVHTISHITILQTLEYTMKKGKIDLFREIYNLANDSNQHHMYVAQRIDHDILLHATLKHVDLSIIQQIMDIMTNHHVINFMEIFKKAYHMTQHVFTYLVDKLQVAPHIEYASIASKYNEKIFEYLLSTQQYTLTEVQSLFMDAIANNNDCENLCLYMVANNMKFKNRMIHQINEKCIHHRNVKAFRTIWNYMKHTEINSRTDLVELCCRHAVPEIFIFIIEESKDIEWDKEYFYTTLYSKAIQTGNYILIDYIKNKKFD